MRIPEVFKQQLKEWSELGQSAPAPDPAPEEESDIHSTPAGAWPSRGPKPGKLGIVFSYVSLVLCIIGIITMFKCTYIEEAERPVMVVVGLCLVMAGLVSLSLANWVYNREQRRLVEYLQHRVDLMNGLTGGPARQVA